MISSLSGFASSMLYATKASNAAPASAGTFVPSSTTTSQSTTSSFDARFSYDRISTSFLAYEDQMKTGASDYAKTLADNQDAYLAIVKQAKDSGGLDDPQAFVKGLSATQLDVLQKTHSLADPIQTRNLSREAALNLILPANESLDLNHDGITQTGAASGLVFPPHDAPQAVQDAWKKATAGLDFGTVMSMQMQMSMAGGVTTPTMPADPSSSSASQEVGYTKAVFDWQALLAKTIAGAEANRVNETTDVQRAFGDQLRAGYQALKDAFTANGVA